MDTGHVGYNKEGSSGESSPEIRGDLSDLRLLKCSSDSPCPGAMPTASSSSAGRVAAGTGQGWGGGHSHQEDKS